MNAFNVGGPNVVALSTFSCVLKLSLVFVLTVSYISTEMGRNKIASNVLQWHLCCILQEFLGVFQCLSCKSDFFIYSKAPC